MLHSWQSWKGCSRLVARIRGFDSRSVLCIYISCDNKFVQVHFYCILGLWLFSKRKVNIGLWVLYFISKPSGRFEPTTFLFGVGIVSMRLHRQSNLCGIYYSLIIKTFSSVHFATVHANLYEQTTSSIELIVLKRRLIVVIRKDSRCLLVHRLEQRRRFLLSKETYRTLIQPADPDGNHFGDMIWKIPNPTLRTTRSNNLRSWSVPLQSNRGGNEKRCSYPHGQAQPWKVRAQSDLKINQ